jgi:TPR repeat protein
MKNLLALAVLLAITTALWPQATPPLSKELLQKAQSGDIAAQRIAGYDYHYGIGVGIDYKKARYWFTRAEKQGDGYSAYCLSQMLDHLEGIGDTIDPFSSAFSYMFRAAQLGYTPAYVEVAGYYEQGMQNGFLFKKNPDYVEAAMWYRKAADLQYPKAEYALGRFYEAGLGVPKNTKLALQWYARSAIHNNSDAKARFELLKDQGGIPTDSIPTAICKDGYTSFSQHDDGTCSDHGGVEQWISTKE